MASLGFTPPPKQEGYLRAAVVQLGFHPAFTPRRGRSMIEDPRGDTTLPVSLPPDLQGSLDGLRRRIAEAYEEQLRLRVRAVLQWCSSWGVEVVVFPEYSIPHRVIEAIIQGSGSMVVVAGSHFVDRAALRELDYAKLGAPTAPKLGTAVCPVIAEGKLIACVPKLHASTLDEEQNALVAGEGWSPVELPNGIVSPVGVLLCMDFIDQHNATVRDVVAEHREKIRFWAIPSYTRTTSDFHQTAKNAASRYKQPALYANAADSGGSGVFVDARRDDDDGLPWHLAPKEEGVLVADVDLRTSPPGKATAYGARPSGRVVAVPSFVYRSNRHEAEYAGWVERLQGVLDGARSDLDGLEAAARMKAEPLEHLEHHELPATRGRRLQAFVGTIDDQLNSIADASVLVTEILMPPQVLPLAVLQAALCKGALAVVRQWPRNALAEDGLGLEEQLVAGSRRLEPTAYAPYTSHGGREIERIVDHVRRDAPREEPSQLALKRELYATALEGEWKQDYEEVRDLVNDERYGAASERTERLAREIGGVLAKDPMDAMALAWMARLHLVRASLYLNGQERDRARAELQELDAERLGPSDWLNLARLWADLEEAERATEWLGRAAREADSSGLDPQKVEVTRQIVEIQSGCVPDELLDDEGVRLRAAAAHVEQGALARGVELAAMAVPAATSSVMQIAAAFSIVVRALHWSVFELAEGAKLLEASEIEEAVALLESWLGRLERPQGGLVELPLSEKGIDQVETLRTMYYFAIADPDGEERGLRGHAAEGANVRKALELAGHGDVDGAMRLLPGTENPWLPELQRADFLSLSGDEGKALTLLREVAATYPGRGPVERALAEKELGVGEPKDALRHAELACERVPTRGYRWTLARCLVANGRHERAWSRLERDRERGGWNVLLTLATLSATVAPTEAPSLWQQLGERHPGNALIQLELANAHARLGKTDLAAETAWQTFERAASELPARGLSRCAELQLAANPAGIRHRDRVRRILRILNDRFPGDPEAESYKLLLRLRVGGDSEFPPADFELLETHGLIRKFHVDELVSKMEEWRRSRESLERLYATGAFPVSVLAEFGNRTTVDHIHSMLDNGHPRACAAFPSPRSLSSLRDIEILIADVELLAIAKLGLCGSLADALRRGGSVLLLPDAALGRIHAAREEYEKRTARDSHGEMVRLALDLVHAGREQGWVRIQTWHELRDGLGDPPMPEKPELRAAELGDKARRWQAIVEAPLHEAMEQAAAVLASSRRWRLALDFYGTWTPGIPELFRFLQWSGPQHLLEVSSFLRTAHERCITVPTLVRLLGVDPVEERGHVGVLRHLAKAGFPDALEAAELIEIARAAEKIDLPAEVLSGLEHMARQDSEPVGLIARMRLQDTYANAMARAFLGEPKADDSLEIDAPVLTAVVGSGAGIDTRRSARGPLPLDRARSLAALLLGRMEMLDENGRTQLQAVMSGVLRLALRDPRWAVRQDSNDPSQFALSLDSPVGRLVDAVRDWAGPSGLRWEAWSRAVRETWCLLDEMAGDDGVGELQVLPLILATSSVIEGEKGNSKQLAGAEPSSTHNGRDFALSPMDRLGETLAILSANWHERPLKRGLMVVDLGPGSSGGQVEMDWESILEQAASAMCAAERIEQPFELDERSVHVRLTIPELSVPLSLELPVEAVLLRAPPELVRSALGRLVEAQGSHDGRAYELLKRLQDSPEDPLIRGEYARYTVMAPWRLLRDDPTYLVRWPRSHTTGIGAGFPQLSDLLSVLHEPGDPIGDVPNAMALVESRLDSSWKEFPDGVRRAIYWQLLGLPGLPSIVALSRRQYLGSLAENVEAALQHLDRVDEVPAGWLAQDIIVVLLAMRESPVLKLRRGTVDLRELGPAKIAEIVTKAGRAGPPGTMARNEGTLLRVCARVCWDFLRSQVNRRQEDWIWLTYRLHAWLAAQLEALPVSARREGIEALALLASAPYGDGAPGADPLPDLFDPRYFQVRGFDYRLAMVLFALLAGKEWVQDRAVKPSTGNAQAVEGAGAEAGATGDIVPISTPGLERELLQHAGRLPPPCAQAGSWFGWMLPSNTPDMALVALLRLNSARVVELPSESLLGRIERWPKELSGLGEGERMCVHDLAVSMSHHIEELSQPIRDAFEARLTEWHEPGRTSTLKWLGLTSLFRAGAVHLREAVRPLVIEHLGDSMTPFVLGWYLEGVARSGANLPEEVERLSEDLDGDASTGWSQLAVAVAWLMFHAERRIRDEARSVLLSLATRPGFRNSAAVHELLKAFKLGDPERDS